MVICNEKVEGAGNNNTIELMRDSYILEKITHKMRLKEIGMPSLYYINLMFNFVL